MATFKTYYESAADLERDLIAIKTVHNAPLYVTFNAHSTHKNLVVYTSDAMRIYIPKKYDGYEVLFRTWNGDGQPWIIEFFQYYC